MSEQLKPVPKTCQSCMIRPGVRLVNKRWRCDHCIQQTQKAHVAIRKANKQRLAT